jgi:hypothetical protein
MRVVKLSETEVRWATEVGARRHREAVEQGRKDAHGLTDKGEERHILGALGELAVAKALDRYWSGHVNRFKGPDLSERMQVRCRSEEWHDLIVRQDDADDHGFVLVTGRAPNFVVHGWIIGRDAKRFPLQAYGGREPAHFVPSSALHPIAELP